MYQSHVPHIPRKRAFSENIISPSDEEVNDEIIGITPNRRSETDLSRIDRKRTFEEANFVSINTGDVLARVVQALSTIRSMDDDLDRVRSQDDSGNETGGINGFSDTEILSSECGVLSGLSSGLSGSVSATPPIKRRIRALSDYRVPTRDVPQDPHEWTWNGTNAQIQEFRRIRGDKSNTKFAVLGSGVSKINGNHLHIDIEETRLKSPCPNQSFLRKINPFKKKPINTDDKQTLNELDAQKYIDRTSRGRESKQFPPSKRRPSIFEATEPTDQHLLESTTIADLIRALEQAHVNESENDQQFGISRRKMSVVSSGTPVMPRALQKRRASMIPPPAFGKPYALSERRQSHIPTFKKLGLGDGLNQPPPYSPKVSPCFHQRKFSIRPSGLLPVQNVANAPMFQRRHSLRPSPLSMEPPEVTGRFTVATRRGSQSISQARQKSPQNLSWRPAAQMKASLSGHNSLTELCEKHDDK